MSERIPIHRLDTAEPGFETAFAKLRHWSDDTDAAIEGRVAEIVAAVRGRGDAAVLEYTARFDRLQACSVAALEVPAAELRAAFEALPAPQRQALQDAAERVRGYHARQLEASSRSWQYRDRDGSLLGQKVTPLDRVGIYVPGGLAAYPSSVLMNAIPAQVAGVGEIVMVVPTPGGQRNALVLAAAHLAGVSRAFAVGGAQAVAALAYGTATIPAVDKIVGPGNAYVAEAKRQLYGKVGIDLFAGPTETLVIADETVDGELCAADLLGQAEHGPNSPAVLLTNSEKLARETMVEVERQLKVLPTGEVAAKAWADYGQVIVCSDYEEMVKVADEIASEHVQVMTRDPDFFLRRMTNYGALFLGEKTNVSYGDKVIGTNHTLPTKKAARYTGGLWVGKFLKTCTYQKVLTPEASAFVGEYCSRLCALEGFAGHQEQADIRVRRYRGTGARAANG